VQAPDGSFFRVTKGAPQSVLRLTHNAAEITADVDKAVQDLADRGFRALGVAMSYTTKDARGEWEPPRDQRPPTHVKRGWPTYLSTLAATPAIEVGEVDAAAATAAAIDTVAKASLSPRLDEEVGFGSGQSKRSKQ
jgi:hypothetical protein